MLGTQVRNRPANINLPLGRKPPAPPFPPGATRLFGITTAPTLPLSLLELVDQKSSLKTSWILQSLKKKKKKKEVLPVLQQFLPISWEFM